ncbi:MAG: arginine--tRNA ligase, partial [Acidimicrobiales bacterium]
GIARVDVAGPGFLNVTLDAAAAGDLARVIVEAGEAYGRSSDLAGVRTNLEFVSANPTGPIHLGGTRWAAVGDSLGRILEAMGAEVTREYYFNDHGAQVDRFARSLLARAHGRPAPEDGYGGQYIDEIAQRVIDGAAASGDPDPRTLPDEEAQKYFGAHGVELMFDEIKRQLHDFGVDFDVYFSETSLHASGRVTQAIERLRGSDRLYEADGALWLRTTDFGDDKDRVLIRSDGEVTYFMPDIAYHRDKFNRGDLVIDILGADHHGYVARMRAALQALGYAPDAYEAIIGQNVKLLRHGEEVKLSKRAGTMIEIRDLIDAVGPDVARFAYLLQSVDSPQTLDLDVLTAQAAENPVFYVQYANARIHSLGQQATERSIERRPVADADLSVLVHERELELLRVLSAFPETLELAHRERAPHRVTSWVRELAAAFHGFYRDCPILRTDVDPAVQQARLWLAEGTRIGLAIGLDLLGVEAPEQM